VRPERLGFFPERLPSASRSLLEGDARGRSIKRSTLGVERFFPPRRTKKKKNHSRVILEKARD
jgi:hypothetical protein